jgi:hypothetical protein
MALTVRSVAIASSWHWTQRNLFHEHYILTKHHRTYIPADLVFNEPAMSALTEEFSH